MSIARDELTKRCPICGEQGKKIRVATLQNIIKDDCIPPTLEGYYLCLSNQCEVIYFGQKIFNKDDINVKVWYKEKDYSIPVCYCKNVTKEDIIEHIAIRGCCLDLNDIQKHTGATTGKECLTKNPAGT